MFPKKLLFFLFAFILLAAIVFTFYTYGRKPKQPAITNFAQCVAAGYPVMQSYPPECTLPNGTFFVQSTVSDGPQ